jgi:transcriptional regulator with XRE-family HTH domain
MTDGLHRRLGTRIRLLRKNQGFSIGKLAEMADLDVSFLGQIELGKRDPSLSTLSKIARGLAVPIASLFSDAKAPTLNADERILQHVRMITHGRTKSQKADIFAILKQLQGIERIKALRQLVRR